MPTSLTKNSKRGEFDSGTVYFLIQNIKKEKDSRIDDPEDQIFVKCFEKFEFDVLLYFSNNRNVDILEATKYFTKSIIKIRGLTTKLIAKYNLQSGVAGFFEEEINSITSNNYRLNSPLSLTTINSLSTFKEPELPSFISLVDSNDMGQQFDDFFINEKNDHFIELLYDTSSRSKSRDTELVRLVDKFGDFFVGSFVIDLGLVLYDLKSDNKLLFDVNTEIQISKTIDFYNTIYKNKIPEFHDLIQHSRYLGNINATIDGLSDYIVEHEIQDFADLKKAIENVISFKDLEKNWDDDNADPISLKHIRDAIIAISSIFYVYKKAPSFTAPTFLSGVLIEYNNPLTQKRLDIKFEEESKTSSVLFSNGKIIFKKMFEINDIHILYE